MSKYSIEIKLGVFVLGALFLLIIFVMVLGDFRLLPGYTIYGDFAYVGSLQAGAPVRAGGVRVGRVTKVKLLDSKSSPAPALPSNTDGEPALVRTTLSLDKEAGPLLTEGAALFVGMQGVIGEAYVEMSPGKPGAKAIEDGVSLRGVDAPRLHILARNLVVFVETLGAIVGTVEDPQLGLLGSSLADFLGSLGGLVKERRQELSQALSNLATITEDLKAISSQARKVIGDGTALGGLVADAGSSAAILRRDLPDILARASRSIKAVEILAERLNSATSDAQIESVKTSLKAVSENLAATSLDARRVMNTIRQGQGSLGGFIKDPQIYEDTKEMLRDIKRNPWKILWRD